MRRKKRSLKSQLILCALVALLLCILPTVLSVAGAKNVLYGGISTVSSPLTDLLSKAGKGLSAALQNSNGYAELEEQLDKTNQELTVLREQLALMESIKAQNEQLRDYLDLKDAHQTLNWTDAAIIYNNDPSGRTVTLNKGSRQGIEVGMPVLHAGGLYGTVSAVSATTCEVTTMQEETLFIGAQIVRSGVNGTLCGLQKGEVYAKLQYMDANMDHSTAMQVGDIVTTSGYGEHYPYGILIGEIVEVGLDPYDRSPYAYVRLYATDTTSTTLMIVTGQSTGEEVSGDES